MSQETPKHFRNKISLQCYLTIPLLVKIISDNRIGLNENIYVFKDLNVFPPLYHWLTYEYIDAEVKMKVDKIKGQLTGNEMEK